MAKTKARVSTPNAAVAIMMEGMAPDVAEVAKEEAADQRAEEPATENVAHHHPVEVFARQVGAAKAMAWELKPSKKMIIQEIG